MSNELTTTNGASFAPVMTNAQHAELFTQLVLKSDLSGLSELQRVEYYKLVCERTGLDPTTRPFDLISLSGKLTLYANKSAAAQLTAAHALRVEIVDKQIVNGLCVVTARAAKPNGSYSDDLGVATIDGLRGEAAANAMLKAVTKAKRRAILSVCGLGMLDETEVDTIPGAQQVEVPRAAIAAAPTDAEQATIDMWRDTLEGCTDAEGLNQMVADLRKAPQVIKDALGPLFTKHAESLRLVWKSGVGYVPVMTGTVDAK